MTDHTIDPTRIHHKWDNSLEPTLVIESGDTVGFELQMAGRGQVERGAGFDRASFDDDTSTTFSGRSLRCQMRPGRL